MPGEQAVLEIRPVLGADDFGEEVTPALRAQEERLRAVVEPGVARTKIFPHLWYAAEAEEAAAFYASIFPDSAVERVTTLPSASPSGPPGSVKIVDFTLFGQRFQAISAGPHHEFNDAVSFVVLCDDQAELDRYWDALLTGGGTPQACGWLTDRFGVRWQVVPAVLDVLMADPDPARVRRVSDALLGMVKIDVAALEAAYRG
jgi:predicted 3-demethylubiquinone-9 3-methyltransferase (glyoxalase superfamily)